VLRSDVLLELHEETALTDAHMERVEGLHAVETLGRDIALAQRRHAEVDEGVPEG
jgi:hypothetical protein